MAEDDIEDSRDDDQEESAEARTLGLERWVQFAFVVTALITFFLTDKLITFVWSFFAEPRSAIVTGAAAIVGLLTGFGLYRHPRVKTMADEVAGELSKVSWPSRQETWRNTLVTIITSIIAAVYLGLFDTLWSTFTDLIYATS